MLLKHYQLGDAESDITTLTTSLFRYNQLNLAVLPRDLTLLALLTPRVESMFWG
jgi:hypothetical protein